MPDLGHRGGRGRCARRRGIGNKPSGSQPAGALRWKEVASQTQGTRSRASSPASPRARPRRRARGGSSASEGSTCCMTSSTRKLAFAAAAAAGQRSAASPRVRHRAVGAPAWQPARAVPHRLALSTTVLGQGAPACRRRLQRHGLTETIKKGLRLTTSRRTPTTLTGSMADEGGAASTARSWMTSRRGVSSGTADTAAGTDPVHPGGDAGTRRRDRDRGRMTPRRGARHWVRLTGCGHQGRVLRLRRDLWPPPTTCSSTRRTPSRSAASEVDLLGRARSAVRGEIAILSAAATGDEPERWIKYMKTARQVPEHETRLTVPRQRQPGGISDGAPGPADGICRTGGGWLPQHAVGDRRRRSTSQKHPELKGEVSWRGVGSSVGGCEAGTSFDGTVEWVRGAGTRTTWATSREFRPLGLASGTYELKPHRDLQWRQAGRTDDRAPSADTGPWWFSAAHYIDELSELTAKTSDRSDLRGRALRARPGPEGLVGQPTDTP